VSEQITVRHAVVFGGPQDGFAHPTFTVERGKPHVCTDTIYPSIKGTEFQIRRTKNSEGKPVTLLVHPHAAHLYEED